MSTKREASIIAVLRAVDGTSDVFAVAAVLGRAPESVGRSLVALARTEVPMVERLPLGPAAIYRLTEAGRARIAVVPKSTEGAAQ